MSYEKYNASVSIGLVDIQASHYPSLVGNVVQGLGDGSQGA